MAELATHGIETSDEWIVARTGIRARHFAAPEVCSSDLGLKAAQQALQAAGLQASDIDLIIVATSTPDMVFPSTACILQNKLGANGCPAFDVQAVCSGFIYALTVADAMIKTGSASKALVVGAEVFSRILDFKDRTTCVLFGDGAGAAILQNRANSHGLLTTALGSDGSKAELLSMPAGGSRCPASAQSVLDGLHFLRMDGKETFKNAVQAMCSAAAEVLARCEIDITKIKCVIPHQANRRIIDAVGERLGATPEQLFIKNPARRPDFDCCLRGRLDVGRGGDRMVKLKFDGIRRRARFD